MPIGTLKYKQDNGSIVELKPAGYVETTTYTAGQAAQNANITEAHKRLDSHATEININTKNIGDWKTDHPGQTINECATSLENEVAAVDAKADAADTKATNNATKNVEQDGRLDALEKLFTFDTITDMCKAVKNAKGIFSSDTSHGGFTFTPAQSTRAANIKVANAFFACFFPYPVNCTEKKADIAPVSSTVIVEYSFADDTDTRINSTKVGLSSEDITLNTVSWTQSVRQLRGFITLHNGEPIYPANSIPRGATILGVSLILNFN